MLLYQSIPVWFQKLFPGLHWKIECSEPIAYLTFDDGPHPEVTPWVLDLLDEYKMKGTFFCVGDNAKKYPQIVHEIINRGHQLGNHTMHHLKGWSTENNQYFENIRECAQWVDSNLFRPPYGRIKTSQSKEIRKKYKIIMWSLLSLDFQKNLNKEAALNGLKNKTVPGSIVVFHDSEKAEINLKYLLPEYLKFLNQKKYQCLPLTV